LSKYEFYRQIAAAGFTIVQERIIRKAEIASSNTHIYRSIERQIKKLIEQFPDKNELFQNYLKEQQMENQRLENQIVCGVWLLQSIAS